jgi:isopropylmalate/homocitrate/citramalate synthase
LRFEEIFTGAELERARTALQRYRPAGAYEPGKWMVHPLNRTIGTERGRFPKKVALRDITLRTTEQMPGLVNTAEERLALMAALAEAGVPEIVASMFRRGHTLEEMRREVQTAKGIAPDCRIVYDNAVKPEELELAVAAGIDTVDVWSAVYLGEAMPVSAGAVYHRAWQGRDWRDLNFPASPEAHLERVRRLVKAGAALGLRMCSAMNLLSYATEEYVALHCRLVAEAGAAEIVLMDSSGGTGPEAMVRLIEVAKEAAPGLRIGVHCHNMYGLAIGNSLAAARAGADLIEVSVNGYEVGPAGCQASLAGTATALEALYGVDTGIDLSRMSHIAKLAETLTGWEVPWNEPVLGSGILVHSSGDEYEQEQKFDHLIHGSLQFDVVGAKPLRQIGVATGPLNMWDKLTDLGIEADKGQVEPILKACFAEMRARRRALEDDEIREVALRILAPVS